VAVEDLCNLPTLLLAPAQVRYLSKLTTPLGIGPSESCRGGVNARRIGPTFALSAIVPGCA
jgi:hypothetical protein